VIGKKMHQPLTDHTRGAQNSRAPSFFCLHYWATSL
jgi:hypothetical protein